MTYRSLRKLNNELLHDSCWPCLLVPNPYSLLSEENSVKHTFATLNDLKAATGQKLGPTDWLEITQERVQQFAEATSDEQWIHLDQQRAATESPFGQTVAHGYLTISLATMLMEQLFELKGASLQINYGLNRLRFPAPVLVGSNVRLHATIAEVSEVKGGVQVIFDISYENDQQSKPVCVAQSVARFYL